MFFKPETIPTDAITTSPWKVAIIDDGHEVHSVTRLVLNGLTIDGHPLTFFVRLFRRRGAGAVPPA